MSSKPRLKLRYNPFTRSSKIWQQRGMCSLYVKIWSGYYIVRVNWKQGWTVWKEIQSMEETPLPPKSVSNSINALEQYTRRNSLRIRGIPEVDRETGEMCIHKVVNFCRIKLGLDLQPECIDRDRAHRVGRKENATAQRVMLVKFVSWQDRDRVFRARSKLKGKRDDQDKPLLVLADLTRENMRIFSAALSAKNRGRIKDTWVNANCRIMIILTDNTRKNIDCVEDLP
ncbi:Hypp8737 [Branchiostoma lanceolatum]|uniref:Hypp8737 protein n=1 Tax=Branchiostoma lanceolatum TaxID=7740 RepID=A0A8J9ZA96_BRALA|nr:Hypp8737 [Branchiostoma lanceolatum]